MCIFDFIKIIGLVLVVVGAYFLYKSFIKKDLLKDAFALSLIICGFVCFLYTSNSHLEKKRNELRSEVIETLVKKVTIEQKIIQEYGDFENDICNGFRNYYDNLYDSQIEGLLNDIEKIENYLNRDNK